MQSPHAPRAINGKKKLEQRAMLLRKTGVETNERDTFIKCRTVENMSEKLVEEKKRLNDRLVSKADRLAKCLQLNWFWQSKQPAKRLVRGSLRPLRADNKCCEAQKLV